MQPEFIKKAVVKVLHALKPRYHIFLVAGFETPMLTGFLHAAAPALTGAAGNKLELYPDFSSDTVILKGFIKIRILLLQLLVTGVQIFFNVKRRLKNG